MRITIAASDLHDALKQSAYARATPLDALKHVLIESIDAHHVAVEATDGAARTRITLPAQVADTGAALLEGAKLTAVAAGGGELAMDRTGKVCRGRSRYALPALPPQDFPRADDSGFEPTGIDPVSLAAAIQQVEHAPDDKDVRPFCRAVFVANGYVAGGNGAVISAVAMPSDAPVLMLPAAQLRHLHGLLHDESNVLAGNVRDAATGQRRAGLVRVESGNVAVTITCVDAVPFDVRTLLNSLRLPPGHIVLKRKPFIDAVRRFTPFGVQYSKGDSGVVLVRRDGQLCIANRSQDADNSEDVTDHVVEAEGGDFALGLAHNYLLSVLNAIETDEVDYYPCPLKPNLFLPRGGELNQVAHLIAPQGLKG